MKRMKLECPYCGRELEAEESVRMIHCPYCQNDVWISGALNEGKPIARNWNEADERKEDSMRNGTKPSRRRPGKLSLIFLVFCLLGAFAAFRTNHIPAGAIALLQAALLAGARLIAKGKIHAIGGVQIPSWVLTLLAAVLIVPYLSFMNAKVYETYRWPDTEAAAQLPRPDSKYGTISYSHEKDLSMRVEKVSETEYRNYRKACQEKGFVIDGDDSYGYEAYNDAGYHLSLSYYSSSQEMTIRLEEPLALMEFSWPVSVLSDRLPAPSSCRGSIARDRSDVFDLYVADINETAYREYVDQLLASGYTVDYQRTATSFHGYDEAGYEVSADYSGNHTMRITLYAPDEPAQETAVPESIEPEATEAPVTKEEPAPAETPSETTAPAESGIRPEFREMMENYEAFYDEYIAFMEKYSSSDNPAAMMADYLSLMNRMNEWASEMDKIDEQELSKEELLLYNEVNLRVASKLNAAAIRMG